MTWRALAIVTVLVLGVVAVSADIYSWKPAPFVADPNDAGIWPGQDIYPGLWWAFDDSTNYHYFRMDLEMAPSNPDGVPNYANLYGIYITTGPGGGSGSDPLVPDALNGIDYILDMVWSPGNSFVDTRYHYWDGGAFQTVSYPGAGYGISHEQANSGQSLQWRIPAGSLAWSDDFSFWGATHNPGSGNPTRGVTFDITDKATIPEPGSMALFGLGLVGAAFLKRRRNSK